MASLLTTEKIVCSPRMSTPRPISRQRLESTQNTYEESTDHSNDSLQSDLIQSNGLKKKSHKRENSKYNSPNTNADENDLGSSYSSHESNSNSPYQESANSLAFSDYQNLSHNSSPIDSKSEECSITALRNESENASAISFGNCELSEKPFSQISAEALHTSRYKMESQYFKAVPQKEPDIIKILNEDMNTLDSVQKSSCNTPLESSPAESRYEEAAPVFSETNFEMEATKQRPLQTTDTTLEQKENLDIEKLLSPSLIDSLGNDFNDQVMSIVKTILTDTQTCLNGFKDANKSLLLQKNKLQKKEKHLEAQIKDSLSKITFANERIQKLEKELQISELKQKAMQADFTKKINKRENELQLEIQRNEIIIDDLKKELRNQRLQAKEFSSKLKTMDEEDGGAVLRQTEALEKTVVEYRESLNLLQKQLNAMHKNFDQIEEENQFLHQKNEELQTKCEISLSREQELLQELDQKTYDIEHQIENLIHCRINQKLQEVKKHYKRKVLRLKNLVRYLQKREFATTQINDKMFKKFLLIAEELCGSQTLRTKSQHQLDYVNSLNTDSLLIDKCDSLNFTSEIGHATACFWNTTKPTQNFDFANYPKSLIAD